MALNAEVPFLLPFSGQYWELKAEHLLIMQMPGFFAAQIGSMADEGVIYAGERPALRAVRIEKNLNALEES